MAVDWVEVVRQAAGKGMTSTSGLTGQDWINEAQRIQESKSPTYNPQDQARIDLSAMLGTTQNTTQNTNPDLSNFKYQTGSDVYGNPTYGILPEWAYNTIYSPDGTGGTINPPQPVYTQGYLGDAQVAGMALPRQGINWVDIVRQAAAKGMTSTGGLTGQDWINQAMQRQEMKSPTQWTNPNELIAINQENWTKSYNTDGKEYAINPLTGEPVWTGNYDANKDQNLQDMIAQNNLDEEKANALKTYYEGLIEIERQKLAESSRQSQQQIEAQLRQFNQQLAENARQFDWLHPSGGMANFGGANTMSRQDWERMSPTQKIQFENSVAAGYIPAPFWWKYRNSIQMNPSLRISGRPPV